MTLTFRITLSAVCVCLLCVPYADADPLKTKRRRPATELDQSGDLATPGIPGVPRTSPGFMYGQDPRLGRAASQRTIYPARPVPVNSAPTPSARNVRSAGANSSRPQNGVANRSQNETHDQNGSRKSPSIVRKPQNAGQKTGQTKTSSPTVPARAAALPGKGRVPATPAPVQPGTQSPDRDVQQKDHLLVVPTRNPADIQNAFTPQGPQSAPVMTPAPAPPVMNMVPSQALSGAPAPDARPVSRDQNRVFDSLSEDERVKLHTAHQSALADPGLAATRSRYLQAREEYRQQLRNALLKADPAVQPILEKVKKSPADQR